MDDLTFESGLLRLPSELILLINNSLEYHSEVNALSRVSRRFYSLLNPILYQQIASSGDRHALTWAVRRGVEAAARKAILAGITPTLDDVKVTIREDNESMVELLCKELALDEEGYDEPWRLSALTEISELATSRRNTSMTRLFLSYGAQPDFNLYKAAKLGEIQMAEMLVEAGANVNTLEDGKNTPLKGAAENGHLEMVKWLLDHAADPNFYPDEPFFHYSPLDASLRRGHLDVAQMLLDHGAQVRTSMFLGALDYEHSSAVELLLKNLNLQTGQMDEVEQDLLACVAASFGFIDVLTNMVTQGWWVDSDQLIENPFRNPVTPLKFAARNGQIRAVRFLISHGAKVLVHCSSACPLIPALEEGHEEIVRILLETLTDEEPGYSQNLFEASRMASDTIVQLLLDHKVPLDPEAMPDIVSWLAPQHVHMFLDAGYNIIDDPEYLGENYSLLKLVVNCDKEVLDALIQHGFDPRPENDANEKEALFNAAKKHNTDLLRLLIFRGFNVRRSEWQASLLAECAASGSGSAAEAVDFLLAEGLDIKALDENHATPLLILASKERPSSCLGGIQILLDRGANPCYESPSGECPLTAVSGRRDNSSAVQALLECIGKRDDIPFSVVGPQLLRAIPNVVEDWNATFGEKRKVLMQYYWRKKYPVPT